MYLEINGREIGYWRKANHIHNWFIENCAAGLDDCEPITVDKDDLISLRHTCIECLNSPDDASIILPCKSGFFFGAENYDSWYFSDLSNTVTIIDQALNEADFNVDKVQYTASW